MTDRGGRLGTQLVRPSGSSRLKGWVKADAAGGFTDQSLLLTPRGGRWPFDFYDGAQEGCCLPPLNVCGWTSTAGGAKRADS